MRKNHFVALVLVATFSFSCASMQSGSGKGQAAKADIVQPQVEIVQLSSLPAAARHVEGGVPVQYRLRVTNSADTSVTLTSLTVVSQGFGAYSVGQTSRPFSLRVEPAATETVDFWLPATTSGSISGGNGPVTLRLQAHFDSPKGQFDNITVQQVNALGANE